MQNSLVIETLQQTKLIYVGYDQGLSGLANGNGHGFWITDTHITHVTSWNARTPFASGQTELVAEKLRKLFSLAAIQETDWLDTG